MSIKRVIPLTGQTTWCRCRKYRPNSGKMYFFTIFQDFFGVRFLHGFSTCFGIVFGSKSDSKKVPKMSSKTTSKRVNVGSIFGPFLNSVSTFLEAPKSDPKRVPKRAPSKSPQKMYVSLRFRAFYFVHWDFVWAPGVRICRTVGTYRLPD